MLGLIFLISIFSNGFLLLQLFPKNLDRFITWSIVFAFGSLFSISFIYLLSSYIFKELPIPLLIYGLVSILLVIFNRQQFVIRNIKQIFLHRGMLLLGIFFLFSWYLFSKTFGYSHGQFIIASNVYQDFGAHIAFIRSFSHGSNFPPEVPFFAGTGLLYYFGFDFYAGILELLQMRVDIAYNLLSSISFALLLSTIYALGTRIFEKKRIVGILSVILFLFSSNLSFLTYFYRFGLSIKSILGIWHNNIFYEGLPFPYSKLPLAEFWNLNTFTNQRHLIFGILLVLLFVYLLIMHLQQKQRLTTILTILLGVAFGLLSLWHITMFFSLFLLLCGLLLFYPQIRQQIFLILMLGVTIAVPECIAIALHSHNAIIFAPGFLISNNMTLINFFVFWGINLGLSLPLGIFGFLLAKRNEKKLFVIFLLLFLIPNIFHISSRNVFDDHKFFSLWIIFLNLYTAFLLAKFWNSKIVGKVFFVTCLLFLTISGVISFFVIKNDVTTTITDYPSSRFLSWSLTHLPSNQTIFTNGDIYDPLSLLGKKIFLGRPYYVYLYGGNVAERLLQQKILLTATDGKTISKILKDNKIQYVVLYKNNFAPNSKNAYVAFYKENFKVIYEDNNAIVFKED